MNKPAPPPAETNPLSRHVLVGVGLVVVVGLLIVQVPRLLDAGVMPIDDFAEYWAAGKLNLQHGDPYDADQLHKLQQQAGLAEDQDAIIMWNPPPTLTFVMLFGLPDYPVARLIWLLCHMGVIVGCADLLWREYGGSAERRWIAWGVALSFCPALIALKSGQISPLILLGLTGFLCCQRRGHDFWAGAFMILASVKPHMVYLIWVAILFWAIDRRRWMVLLGIAVAGLTALAIPVLINPEVIAQYREATSKRPPFAWITTTFGTLLRMWLGQDQTWLVFLPTALGLIWFMPYWFRHRRTWEWQEQLPLLLLVSNSTAAYGWLGDQVILLAALIPMVAWLERSRREVILWAASTYMALNVVDLAINVFFNQPQHQIWHLWTAPAMLAGFLILRTVTRAPGDGDATRTLTSGPLESERAHA